MRAQKREAGKLTPFGLQDARMFARTTAIFENIQLEEARDENSEHLGHQRSRGDYHKTR